MMTCMVEGVTSRSCMATGMDLSDVWHDASKSALSLAEAWSAASSAYMLLTGKRCHNNVPAEKFQ